MKLFKQINVMLTISLSSLVIGLIIYLAFRKETYISVIIESCFGCFHLHSVFDVFNNSFVKYYLVDYLWGISLSSSLHLVFLPSSRESVAIIFVVAIFGFVYELLQSCSLINGTGDIIDVLLYLLAGISVSIINLSLKEKQK